MRHDTGTVWLVTNSEISLNFFFYLGQYLSAGTAEGYLDPVCGEDSVEGDEEERDQNPHVLCRLVSFVTH